MGGLFGLPRLAPSTRRRLESFSASRSRAGSASFAAADRLDRAQAEAAGLVAKDFRVQRVAWSILHVSPGLFGRNPMVAPTIDSVFKRAPPPPRRLDLDALAEAMAVTLNAAAADWRDDLLGDAIVTLRRRHPELSPLDIDALLAAIEGRIERGAFGRKGVIE